MEGGISALAVMDKDLRPASEKQPRGNLSPAGPSTAADRTAADETGRTVVGIHLEFCVSTHQACKFKVA